MSKSIVVGAGWSGLACAYYLTKAGQQVTIIDAAPQFGGRARSIDFKGHTVDNGQHICLGAYHTLRNLLSELGIAETSLFNILPMELFAHGKSTLHLKLPKLPAPLHLLTGLLTASNIPWHIKLATIKFCLSLQKINFCLINDCSILDLLKNYHQSEFIIKHLWEPIALAVMTTPINIASAQIFLNVLRLSFTRSYQDSNWYLPTIDLSAILPSHIEEYLRLNHAEIVHSQPIKQLQIKHGVCSSVQSKHITWQADNVVLAIQPSQAATLIQPHPELSDSYAKLTKFTYQPIVTIYFEFPTAVNLYYPMVGVLNATSQWIFDRSIANQPCILSVVISGQGPHLALNHNELASNIMLEITANFPGLPRPINWKVINEKRAAFTCDIQIQAYRPQAPTNIKNLWLTGDYLDTGLPATLEGALLSGKRTAELILESCS